MSQRCRITGKKPLTGNTVSHSNIKRKTRQNPNLRKKRFYNEETGQWVTLRVSTSAIRTINKVGLKKALKMTPKETRRSKSKTKPKFTK